MVLYSDILYTYAVSDMPQSKEFNKIILAVDGSDASKKAAQKALQVILEDEKQLNQNPKRYMEEAFDSIEWFIQENID